MNTSRAIKTAAAAHSLKLCEVAERAGQDTKQFYNFLLAKNPTLKSIERAAAAVGCRVVLIDEGGKIYD